MRYIDRQAGLSLVELMIALTLGLLLTLGLTQLLLGSRDSFRLAESTARIQESGRMAHEILGQAVRNADYWGCVKHASVQSVIDDDDDDYDPDLHGFELAVSGSVDVAVADAADTAVTGSHVLTLKGSQSLGISLDGAMNNASAVLDVTSIDGLAVGDILLLTDCSDGVVFQATMLPPGEKIQHNTGENSPGNKSITCPAGSPNSSNCFPKAYTSGDIMRPYIHRYEVRPNGVGGRPALFLVNEAGIAIELIDGVVDMRIQLGVASPGGTAVNNWVDAGAGGVNMDNVIALRVSLLVEGPEDNVASAARSLCFPSWSDCSGGGNWTAADRRLYQEYSTVYSIRNRLISI